MSADAAAVPDPNAAKLPWAYHSLLRLGTLVLVSLAVLVAAWIGSSRRGTLPSQNGWLLIGLASPAVLITAATRWLLEGFHNVRHRQNSVSARLDAVIEVIVDDGAPAIEPPIRGDSSFVLVAGLSRYHRPDCPLVAGKPVRDVDPTGRAASGLLPCGVCRP